MCLTWVPEPADAVCNSGKELLLVVVLPFLVYEDSALSEATAA
jgi:hypothetical protein